MNQDTQQPGAQGASGIIGQKPSSAIDTSPTNRRRIFLRRAAAVLMFLVALFAADRLGALAIESLVMHSQIRFSRLYAGKAAADVLIIGNSRGVNGFYVPVIERELQVSAFNLSYNGLGIGLTEQLFKDYLDHNPAPRMLILEATNVNAGDEVINGLKLYQTSSGRLGEMLNCVNPSNYRACQISHLYRYNTELFMRALYYLPRDDQSWINRYSVDLAYAATYKPDGPGLFACNDTASPSSKLSADGVATMRRVIALARERGIEVRITVTPFMPRHMECLQAEYGAWKEELQAALGPDCRIWDYASAVNEISCFSDPLHMNVTGVDQLFARMRAEGFFAPLETR